MAQYFQVIEQSNEGTIDAIYPNIVEGQQVSYVVNQQDPMQQGQPIIVAGEQYMVLDNQSAIKLQTQPFNVQQTQQQIFYVEPEENGATIETIQMTPPVVLNHQIQTGPPTHTVQQQKILTPTMIIQQPQLVPRQVQQKTTVQRVMQGQMAVPGPRTVIAGPRGTVNRVNVVRTPIRSPAAAGPRAVQSRPVRGVMVSNSPRVNSPRAQLVPRRNITVPIQESVDAVALDDGRVISMAEYQQLVADRRKAENSATVSAMRQQATSTRGMPKIPLKRPPIRAQPAKVTPAVTPPQQQPQVQAAPPEPARTHTPRIIQPTNQDNSKLPQILRNFVSPPEIKDIISKTQHSAEFHNSIRMFVILPNGEQRLITFTTPKEDCTIREILDQVGVPLQEDTKIHVLELNTDGINLVVCVGNVEEEEESTAAEQVVPTSASTPTPSPAPKQASQEQAVKASPITSTEPPPLTETQAPKYIPGKLAVCSHCGFLSDDFNRCLRCKSKLPDGIKSVQATINSPRKNENKKIAIHLKSNGNAKAPAPKKKPKPKVIEQEPVILTLSSDEEDSSTEPKWSPALENIMKKATESSANDVVTKEPTVSEIKALSSKVSDDDDSNEEPTASLSLYCRTVRIGSYRFTPQENILINSKEFVIKVPNPSDPKDIKTITVKRKHLARVLVNFQKSLPLMFYYTFPIVGEQIRKELNFTGDKYFDPVSDEENFKRITFLPESISEEAKCILKVIYGNIPDLLEELSVKEANTILLKTCPRWAIPTGIPRCVTTSDIVQLLIYPPGKGGLSINTEDYICLAQDQFLNDVIIDFYLKYLTENLSAERRDKVHIFSTFFYKRLTTKPAKPTKKSHPTELDPLLTAAQKRHSRVKNWTKNVNLFEKDYIVVPINENAHWFLAIICFPAMNGPHTFDGKPYKIEPIERKKKTVASKPTLPQVKLEKHEVLLLKEQQDESDKDEAEGDDSELESGEESEGAQTPSPTTTAPPKTRPPIKQPCILIMDSLAGASRSRVVATLRDYLTCEHKIKMGTPKVYNKDVIKGACPKVPQQTNFTDCGLYLLQYVESFFTTPVRDFHIPINELKEWFEEIVVTRKREEISNLIKDLMTTYKKDVNLLPNIQFPTQDSMLVEVNDEFEDDEATMEEEEEEDEEQINESCESEEIPEEKSASVSTKGIKLNCSLNKPTSVSSGILQDFTEELVDDATPTPDITEVPRLSNRETMSYLKAKRIIRHKPGESSDAKKPRLTTVTACDQ